MALNVTTAVFAENCNTATASPSLAQWDTEQVLQISGIDLPDSYKVEFSTVYTRNAIPKIGDASGVKIPNELLQRSAPITAYVVLYGENGGRNREYWITIYITPGQPPETITPDPEQADVIDQAIAALNNGVERGEAAATSAEGSARDAEAAAEAVQNLSVAAETLATGEPASVEKTVDPETGAVTLNFGLPRGVKGDPLTYEDLTPEQKAELVQGPILEAQDAAVTAVGNARESAVNAVGSAGTTQVNTVNQAGTTQTGAVNQAGANQVDAVNQAGATQVQAVEDKGAEVLDSIPQDYSDLADDVADLSRQLSDLEDTVSTTQIINTASGAIASFSDGADSMPIRKLVAQIEPVQDLHGQESPYPAGGGKNKLKTGGLVQGAPSDTTFGNAAKRTFTLGTFVTNLTPNNYYQPNRVTQVSVAENAISVTTDAAAYALALPMTGLTVGAVYVVSAVKTNGVITVSFYKEDGTFISNTVENPTNFTVPAETYYTLIHFNPTASGTQATYTDIQLELGSSPTSYAPYSNICPISGHTGAEIEQTGVNLFDKTTAVANERFNQNGTISYVNTSRSDYIPCKPNTRYYFKNVHGSVIMAGVFWYDANKQFLAYSSMSVASPASYEATSPANAAYVGINFRTEDIDTVAINYPATDTTYHPYTGDQISVNWADEAGTVYGGKATLNPDGSADVVSAMGNIASYDGETLPGTWISSMDVYTEGSTPTTGAQVVYELAEPVSYHFDDVGQLKTFLGNNNIWCDIGDTTVEYSADTKLYIDRKIAEALGG